MREEVRKREHDTWEFSDEPAPDLKSRRVQPGLTSSGKAASSQKKSLAIKGDHSEGLHYD